MTPKSMWFQNTETNILALSPVVPNQLAFATDTKRWWITNLAASAWEPAALSPRGAWSSGATYKKSDIVTSAGSAWLALRTSTAVTPVEGLDWTLFVSKGDTGTTGASAAPFTDTTALVKGSADASKLVRVEADGLTTGTTRVITMPDRDVDLGTVEDSLLRVSRTEVSITAATTLTPTAFGKLHRCSGTSADYTVGLPTCVGNAGKIIGFEMSPALTKLVTLDANGTETIDTALTRVMWAQEVAWLKVKADESGYTKIAGQSRPMSVLLKHNAAQTIVNATFVKLLLNTIVQNNGGMADTANNRVVVKRAATLEIVGAIGLGALASTPVPRLLANVYLNGSGTHQFESSTYSGSSYPTVITPPLLANFSAGDILELYCYQESGVSRSTEAGVSLLLIKEYGP